MRASELGSFDVREKSHRYEDMKKEKKRVGIPERCKEAKVHFPCYDEKGMPSPILGGEKGKKICLHGPQGKGRNFGAHNPYLPHLAYLKKRNAFASYWGGEEKGRLAS